MLTYASWKSHEAKAKQGGKELSKALQSYERGEKDEEDPETMLGLLDEVEGAVDKVEKNKDLPADTEKLLKPVAKDIASERSVQQRELKSLEAAVGIFKDAKGYKAEVKTELRKVALGKTMHFAAGVG